ncbi:MAG: hypothetical protein RIR18_2035 [Pseudomonadota bacterium]|jgi:predicted DNA-binding transcriptional regulator YafY
MSFTPETLLRHWQTLRLIPRYPRKITAGEVRDRLESEGFSIGKRTVERDLLSLSKIFPLLLDERTKPFGWSWDKDAPAFDLPGISLTESLTLLMARQFLNSVMPHSMLTQLAPHFRAAEQKLGALDGHSSLASWMDRIRIIPASQPLLLPDIDAEVEATVQSALLHNQQCALSYQSKDSFDPDEYPVTPLGLVQRGGLMYLVCTIRTYIQPRILALHRIRRATLLDLPGIVPTAFNLDDYLASGAFSWGNGESVSLVLRFSQAAGSHLYETPLSSNQSITSDPDGWLRVTATVPESKQLIWWILGFGADVEVLEPHSLRQHIANVLNNAAGNYGLTLFS